MMFRALAVLLAALFSQVANAKDGASFAAESVSACTIAVTSTPLPPGSEIRLRIAKLSAAPKDGFIGIGMQAGPGIRHYQRPGIFRIANLTVGQVLTFAVTEGGVHAVYLGSRTVECVSGVTIESEAEHDRLHFGDGTVIVEAKTIQPSF